MPDLLLSALREMLVMRFRTTPTGKKGKIFLLNPQTKNRKYR